MGSVHSVITSAQSRYTPILDSGDAHDRCTVCGTYYSAPHSEYHQTLEESQLHYPAVLCGLWLSKRDREPLWEDETTKNNASLYETIDSTVQSTRLPERVVPPPKPSKIVAALLRHTDFTKTERSALKRGFFSTLDVFGVPMGDNAKLEGCHIHGCLFVEHGNLVFQAVDRARLPHLLTNCNVTNTIHADFNHGTLHNQAPGPTQAFSTCSISYTNNSSLYRRTGNRFISVLRDTYSSKAKHKYLCHHCRVWVPTVLRPLKTQNNPSHPAETLDHDLGPGDQTRFPPPPLRLSWPLFTLRRFGFYGNSLFKLEAGRRAPRGEGHYLFIIEGLRGFRRHFEKYVHRRKSISPHASPQVHQSRHRFPHSTTKSDPLNARSSQQLCQSEFFNIPLPRLPARGLQHLTQSSDKMSTDFFKKKSNSLSYPPVTRLTYAHKSQTIRGSYPSHSNANLTGLQSSWPQLACSTVLSDSTTLDDISALPCPPPPPTLHVDPTIPVSPYDNIQALCTPATTAPINVSVTSPAVTLEWLNSTSMHTSRRPYASRRAMTALVCSNHCPTVPCEFVTSHSHSQSKPPPSTTTSAMVRRSKTDADDRRHVCSRAVCFPEPIIGCSATQNTTNEAPLDQTISSGAAGVANMDEPISVHSPYYNLNSPEALFHMGRTRSLTHYDSSAGDDATITSRKRRSVAVASSPASWNSTLQRRVNTEDLPQPAHQASSSLDSAVNASSDSTCDPIHLGGVEHHRSEPVTPLHYATLDFDESDLPERHQLPIVQPCCLGAHQSSSETANCPVHAYGTLMSGAALSAHQRVRSSMGLLTQSANAHTANLGNDLPTNYVAICQLQTLAMRAVLNATT